LILDKIREIGHYTKNGEFSKMNERNFHALLQNRWDNGFFACVGLDLDPKKIPEVVLGKTPAERALTFGRVIVSATANFVCAYKLNSAFFEAMGKQGLETLGQLVTFIHQEAPEIPVIMDGKRGDIGNTSSAYAAAAFDFLRADAVTLSPYLGAEALQPFLNRPEKGIIVLCRTSNPGASEFQDLKIGLTGEQLHSLLNGPARKLGTTESWNPQMPLFQYLALRVANHWNVNGNCALVVGATYPEELKVVRQSVGDMPILIPGIGRQGGDLEKTIAAGINSQRQGVIINSSRAIIFASSGEDFAVAARREVMKLHEQISQCIKGD